MSQVIKSKYGYHNCDYATWSKLKFLHKLYWEAVRMKANWDRWNRKDPKNRVIRRRIKNDKGQVIGYQAPEPLPEPNVESPFLRKYEARKGSEGRDVLQLLHRNVLDAFHSTRPQKTPEEVKPLGMTLSEIESLFLTTQKQAA